MMKSQKILIIKLGARGDVVRTTPVLRRLKGNVTWLAERESLPILQGNPFIDHVLCFQDYRKLLNSKFDWVINLEEDWKARALCELVKAEKKTSWCKEWCLMTMDDDIKKKNKKSYQYFMFKSLGLEFGGEEYVLNESAKIVNDNIIGIERRLSDRWKLKLWDKYSKLISLLKENGFKVKVFKYRKNINDFVKDINDCKVIVSGDTLAMHLGLGLRKKVVAIFGPTSSSEICSYGRMKKLVSPIACQCCYKKECNNLPNCMDLVPVKEVFDAILLSLA